MKRVIVVIAVVVVLIAVGMMLRSPHVTNPEPTGDNIICFGDSLTYGTGAGRENCYPAQLERIIGQPVINAGVPGDTTASALARLESDVLDRSPRIVLITLGGNDLKNGLDKDEAFANLERIVTRIHDRGALVIVGGVNIPLYGRGFANGYRDLCKETGCVLVPNVFEDIMGQPSLMSDRIHPNAKGYANMAEHFHDALEPYL
jgi:lysophospholipase L1-like esterase